MNDELMTMLIDMDIPAKRTSDIGWLKRNLGIRNSEHPNFNRAIELLTKELHESRK